MMNFYCCPSCKKPLAKNQAALTCMACGRSFPIINGIADFFSVENEQEVVDEVSAIWQDEKIVIARDSIYSLCTRELKGMAFCMQEIARQTGAGTRILEVGMGTGHFTRWMAEVAAPGTEIYAFDCSWPILQTAQAKLGNMPDIHLCRANSRGKLPFLDASFDILLLRLAPLGPHGVPNVTVGLQLLKPGGWYFEAGWDRTYEGSWTDWAIQHGFEHAEHHSWQYSRYVTEGEIFSSQVEQAKAPADMKEKPPVFKGNVRITIENLLIAQKPRSIL